MTTAEKARAEVRTSEDAAPAAEVVDVTVAYGDNVVLRGTHLRVGAGEVVAIIGRSGCGKSTLLRLFAGLTEPSSGTVRTAGAPAVAFQEPRLFPWRTVRENVAFGLTRARLRKSRVLASADETLAEVGLADKRDAWPAQLSGGQAQRVSLARALVAEPELLLLDEPFGALDALTRASMHDLLITLWQRHGFGVVVVTHDVDEALALADRVVVLADGTITTEIVVENPRQRARDGALIEHRTRLLAALGEQ
ncbi:ABC transporter ATP-binding protein [Tsukamurella asaccharolytica]|uniref:ABC transporter ATP-binding protein n=1 Tax=Tsukamurella asaccharolytica TaxID=2592067 RepID=A0A5C5R9H5_9ACTN|nr:ABC transporter ATP-binding protein [Tsukamurella asaccharolytica]TWS18735.1 ABC transporter ATP-binding protein [Tsukamurella asaccharolytica]